MAKTRRGPAKRAGDLERSARIAGLKGGTPSLEQIEHRRSELLAVGGAVVIGFALALVALSTQLAVPEVWLDGLGPTGTVLRVLVVLLTLAFGGYVFEKERHLKRLSSALVHERIRSAELQNRLRDIGSLTEATKAVLQAIELDEVLAVILRSASELLGADDGSVLLPAGEEFVVAARTGASAATVGERRPRNEGLLARVAANREPVLIEGTAEPSDAEARSEMFVPLVAKGELLGILEVSVAAGERRFTPYDLRILALFGEHAAIAVRHARMLRKEVLLREQLADQDRVRNELVGTMTHDLKSPLTTILGSVQFLLEAELPEVQRLQRLEAIERASNRLLRLIEQMLAAARAQSRPPLAHASIDLVEQIEPLAASFSSAHGRSIEVRTTRSGVRAQADPEALDQVVSVLLENACVHTPDGTSVAVEIGSSNGSAEITISDDGPGISASDLPHLFVPFRRGDKRTKGGAGLGLFIASNLIQSMGGNISVSSRPGEGTAIRFTLPERAAATELSA